jgi:hypothetical protein
MAGGKNLEVPAVTGTLDVYMAEINRFSILTADEEFRLAGRGETRRFESALRGQDCP